MLSEVNVGEPEAIVGGRQCLWCRGTPNTRRTGVSDGVGALGSGEGETRTMARVFVHRDNRAPL